MKSPLFSSVQFMMETSTLLPLRPSPPVQNEFNSWRWCDHSARAATTFFSSSKKKVESSWRRRTIWLDMRSTHSEMKHYLCTKSKQSNKKTGWQGNCFWKVHNVAVGGWSVLLICMVSFVCELCFGDWIINSTSRRLHPVGVCICWNDRLEIFHVWCMGFPIAGKKEREERTKRKHTGTMSYIVSPWNFWIIHEYVKGSIDL